MRKIAVILPVYRGVNLTRNCIDSAMPDILRVDGARLLIVDDASPEPEMEKVLSNAHGKWSTKVDLIKNHENMGFVKSVNKALNHASTYDVVLLNSDVITPNKWLERLRVEAYSEERIATVTPFSNNSTICTFPEFLQKNDFFATAGVTSIDAVFKSPRLPNIEAPTGVGFCMFIKRDCLDQIGLLNEYEFPKGYGEENDLCQRAIKRRWKNMITPNLYVYHKGNVSFGDEKPKLIESALKTLGRLHKNYHHDVQSFVQNDPLRQSRIFRFIRFLSSKKIPKVLHISHGLGGGVKTHIERLCERLNKNTNSFSIILFPAVEGNARIRLGATDSADEFFLPSNTTQEDLLYLMKVIGISLIHYHHALNLTDELLTLHQKLKVPYRFTVHDYYLICGNPTLTNKDGFFTENKSEWLGNNLHKLPSEMTADTWRERYSQFFKQAEIVIFPSVAAHRILKNYYSSSCIVIAPHPERKRYANKRPTIFQKKPSYNIGAIGALGKEKGADRLEALARINQFKHGRKINFILIGYAYKPLINVKTTGEYKENEALSIIKSQNLDVILFTAKCPETYSYTLSIALETGLPIIAPDIGAFPERLAGREASCLYSFDVKPESLFKELLGFIENLEKGKPINIPEFSFGENYNKDFYEKEYVDGLKSRLGNALEWHDLQERTVNTSKSRQGEGMRLFMRRYLWRLSYSAWFSWLRSDRLSFLRFSIKRFLDN